MADEGREEQRASGGGRGPAYPFISLPKAIERVEELRDANLTRVATSPISLYRVWGWSGDHGAARQTLAALNHFGLVEYVGRGDDRQVELSDLARRIVLDRVPNSTERAAAVKEAALTPPIHQKLWDKYRHELPPDVVIETFLMRDNKFSEEAATKLIGEYRDTFEYAGLDKPDKMPSSGAADFFAQVLTQQPKAAAGDKGEMHQVHTATASPIAMDAVNENDIKIMIDGDRIRVSAYVDAKGAKRLLKRLQANIALLEDDSDDEDGR